MKSNAFLSVLLITLALFYQCKIDKSEDASTLAETLWFQDYESPNNKWGYFNSNGEVAIKPQFDDCKPFKNSIACVSQNGYWGAINRSGEWVIKPKNKALWSIHNDRLRFQNFERKYGFINLSGEEIIPAIFNEALDFSDGLASVNNKKGYGYIDLAGNFVFDTIFEKASSFNDGYAIVSKGGQSGIINKDGQFVIDPTYERIRQGENGQFTLVDENETILFDANKSRIINKISDYKVSVVKDGMYYGTKVSASKIYNIKDQESVDVPFRIDYYAGHHLFVLSKDGKMGLCDGKGKIIQDGLDQIHKFSNNRAAFMKNEMWGFLDTNGKVVIRAKWPLCWSFSENTARVIDQFGFSVIDTNGNKRFTQIVSELRQPSEQLFAFQQLIVE